MLNGAVKKKVARLGSRGGLFNLRSRNLTQSGLGALEGQAWVWVLFPNPLAKGLTVTFRAGCSLGGRIFSPPKNP